MSFESVNWLGCHFAIVTIVFAVVEMSVDVTTITVDTDESLVIVSVMKNVPETAVKSVVVTSLILYIRLEVRQLYISDKR